MAKKPVQPPKPEVSKNPPYVEEYGEVSSNPPSASTRIVLFNGLYRRITNKEMRSYATYTNALRGGPGWEFDKAWCAEDLTGLR